MQLNRLVYSINIKADQNKIWNILWNENSYKNWANVFFEGSYIVADDYEVGSTVLFLDPDQNGIYSNIIEHIPNLTILFKHNGAVQKGEKQAIDEESKKWSGALERYTVTNENIGISKLTIKIDVLDEHLEFMTEKLPKALARIEELCE
jgi:hypothetical protein